MALKKVAKAMCPPRAVDEMWPLQVINKMCTPKVVSKIWPPRVVNKK